jgi:hypothetical protein
MSAAAWAEFGRALGAGALKNLKEMVLDGLILFTDISVSQ